jgi:PAS domain S-box-containing protein
MKPPEKDPRSAQDFCSDDPAQLRVDAKRYRFLTETISDVIWTMDLDQRITYTSPSIEPLTGYTVEEMKQMELREILAPESFALAREILLEELRLEYQPDLESSPSRTLDLNLVRKNGSTLWCEAKMGFLRDEGGRPTGVLGLARDISDWREAQEALVESEERLRRAQRLEAVGQLSGGIAHDFNNLLTVILGNIELMLHELPTEGGLHNHAREINHAAERAAALTRQLLAFSRKQMMMPEILDLNQVIGEMKDMLTGLMGEGIDVSFDLQPSLAKIKVDPSQIELVLVNLALNARDAMVDTGRLVIETANARLDSAQISEETEVEDGPYVLLAVTDSGTGIDPDVQAKIFEPFFSTKGVGRGTGLGLSTVYGIVKQSQGYIWVTSRPQQGCRFEIYLPVHEAPIVEESDNLRGERDTVHSPTVLVVEDEDSVRTLTRRVLENRGLTVLEASRAGLAMEILEDTHQRIDLLLTDVIMPGMSGTQLAREAAELRPELEILFMSGHHEEMLNQRAGIEISQKLLRKPFTPAQLLAAIDQSLANSGILSPAVSEGPMG